MTIFNVNPPWLVPLILFLAALLVGLIKVRSVWEEMHEDDDPTSDRERLDELEEAYAAGELDAAEFERIRSLLGGEAPRSKPMPTRVPGVERPSSVDAEARPGEGAVETETESA